jgi:hypothetical protein
MVAPGEKEEEEEGEAVAQPNQDGGPGSIASRPSTTTAAAKPYQGSNTIVMMEWEKGYMETLVGALALREEDEVSQGKERREKSGWEREEGRDSLCVYSYICIFEKYSSAPPPIFLVFFSPEIGWVGYSIRRQMAAPTTCALLKAI